MAREMKDSGIEWIGEIPKEWEIIKVKNIGEYRNGLTYSPSDLVSQDKGTLVLRSSNIQQGKLVFEDNVYVNTKIKPNLMIKQGDILICSRNGSKELIGKNAIINLNIEASFGAFMMIFRCNFPKYMYYILNSPIFSYYLGTFLTATINQLTNNNFGNMKIVFCKNKKEQEKIVNYLDKKVADIDLVIEKTKATIEDYKKYKQSIITEAVTKGLNPDVEMKDSGIEWIGEIPKEWELNKINRIFNTITDYVASGSFADLAKNVIYLDFPNYARLIRTVDISRKRENIQPVYINEDSYNFLKNSNLFGGELILPNIGASVGDVYLVPKLYEKMSLAPNLIMLKTNQKIRYYYYFFLSISGRKMLLDLAQSTAQAKFNKTQLRQLKILQPFLEEQEKIANYLDKKVAEIDNLIAKKESLISEMEEYKKSLIYECVTGKKEII